MNSIKDFDAVDDYIYNIIVKSWTWERLTTEEKEKFLHSIYLIKQQNHIQGTKKQRQIQIMNFYNFFLDGLGYSWSGWRESKQNDIPNF